MTEATQLGSDQLSRRTRFLAAAVGLGLLAVLLIANRLQPDPRGLGTHEQLGLPPCTFHVVVGKPCPACGMTTAWSCFSQGRWLDAIRTHATGTMLAATALITGITAIAIAARGKWPAWHPRETTIAMVAVVAAGFVFLEWIVRLTTQ